MIKAVKARFIFNPRSGHNARNPYLLERARTFIAEHRLDADIAMTERPLHATELARRANAAWDAFLLKRDLVKARAQ